MMLNGEWRIKRNGHVCTVKNRKVYWKNSKMIDQLKFDFTLLDIHHSTGENNNEEKEEEEEGNTLQNKRIILDVSGSQKSYLGELQMKIFFF